MPKANFVHDYRSEYKHVYDNIWYNAQSDIFYEREWDGKWRIAPYRLSCKDWCRMYRPNINIQAIVERLKIVRSHESNGSA